MRKVNFPYAYKLAISMIVLIVTGMLALGALIIRDQNQLLEKQMYSYADILIRQLATSATESYLTSDTLDLDVLVKNLSRHTEIQGIAFYSDEKQPISSKGILPSINRFSDKGKQISSLQWDNNLSFMGHVVYDNVTIGYVVLTFDQSLFTQARIKTMYTIILTTIVLIILTILFAFFLGKRLSRPIEELVTASDAISKGNYKVRFDERRNDEFGILMESLNVMADGLLKKESVEKAFSRYVSPQVAQEVLNNLESINLGGQQIDASVLFVDMIGFTEMSKTMEPGKLTQILNEYFSYIAQAGQIYNGHVDKYIGDCVMLVFGVPEQSEHHSFQAISCALLIQRLITTLNIQREKAGQPIINFHIAVNSGLMLAGNMGSQQRMEYTVIGDAVNLASRIASCAHNNEVIIPDTMLKRQGIREQFTFRKKDCLKLRGHKQPVSLYQVTGCINKAQNHLTKNMEKLINHDFKKKLSAEK